MPQFSVWLMDVGVPPLYSDSALPEQNGRHECMHQDLKAEASLPTVQTLSAQQRKFNQFLRDYNTVRPHEALPMKTPTFGIRAVKQGLFLRCPPQELSF